MTTLCEDMFISVFREMQRCCKCFPSALCAEKKTWLGHGSVEHPCDAELLFLGESPSPHRNFNETFGMKSKPAFKKFVETLTDIVGDIRWWAMNVNNCNVPSRGLTSDPAKQVCPYFWRILRVLAEYGNLKYIVVFGRKATKVLLKRDVPLSGEPRSVCIADKYVLVFPVHHPMFWVRRGDLIGCIAQAEKVGQILRSSIMRWIS